MEEETSSDITGHLCSMFFFVSSWLPVHIHVGIIFLRKWHRWMPLLLEGWGHAWNGSWAMSPKAAVKTCILLLTASPQRTVQFIKVTVRQLRVTGREIHVCVCAGMRVYALVPSCNKSLETFQVSLFLTVSFPSPSMCIVFCSSFVSPSSQPVCHDSCTLWLWFRFHLLSHPVKSMFF